MFLLYLRLLLRFLHFLKENFMVNHKKKNYLIITLKKIFKKCDKNATI